jgi:hypothetical protein
MADYPGSPTFTASDWLEQYKAYLADLGNVGSRYTTANGFYLPVISALGAGPFILSPNSGCPTLLAVFGRGWDIVWN